MSESSESAGTKSNQRSAALFDACAKAFLQILKIFYFGARRLPLKKIEFYVYFIPSLFFLYMVAVTGRHLIVLHSVLGVILPGPVRDYMMTAFASVAPWAHLLVLLVGSLCTLLFTFGIRPFVQWQRYQRAIDCLSLKNGLGRAPKLIAVREDGPHREKLVVLSEGLGADRYEAKKNDLESAFGAVIEGIRQKANPKYIDITLATRRIPSSCSYLELVAKIDKPYSVVIGESLSGPIIISLRDLPHLLIAGTSGGGKSIFLKQTLLGLQQTSPHIQMYLLDLKNGVEVKEFAQIPNVVVAKDAANAVLVLSKVKDEMDRRFIYMEANGYKKIDPERDKMDIIVVAVDEASVLYTKPRYRSKDAELINSARELTDHLAKLARAAGIHLILATQKVTKETVDTKIQENIGGRMCFRMNTLQGSLAVLGNKLAFDLPLHPGRAIWSAGNFTSEVQAPFIGEKEIESECALLAYEYKEGKRKTLQPMLKCTAESLAPKPGQPQFKVVALKGNANK